MKHIKIYATMAVMFTMLLGVNTVFAAPYHTGHSTQAVTTGHSMNASAATGQHNGIVNKVNEPCGAHATIIGMGNGQGVIFIHGKGTFVDGVSLQNQAKELACS